jgi:hypothetical protein
VAALTVPPPGMGGAAFDNLAPHQSLLSRRTAGAHPGLPSFELPNPQNLSQKYPGLSSSSTTQSNSTSNVASPQQSNANVRVGSLLTPPSNNPSENLPTTHAFSLPSNQFAAYSPGYWTGSSSSSYSFNAGMREWFPSSCLVFGSI